MPEPIRIDDLASPILTEAQRNVLAYTDSLDLDLSIDALHQSATALAGSSDFGDPAYRVRVAQYLQAVEDDAGLSSLGRLVQKNRVSRLLANRALLNELLRVHPEIHAIQITAPLIVVGLPRSGTTHLVNLIAADSRRRALPYWESQEPFPRPGEGPGVDGLDPRFARIAAEHASEQAIAPLTKAMHDRFPAAIEEEVELLDLDFSSYTLEWHARVPGWRDAYYGFDQDAHYGYLLTVLRALTFLRGPRQWVLKSPQHLEQLGPLIRTFPDATVAFTHRDPVAVLQSAITMLAYGDRIRRTSVDAPGLAAYWVDRIERLLQACVRDRALVPAEQSIDVVFADAFSGQSMKDDLAVVEQFYAAGGVELTGRARRQLQGYLDANPRGKHGRVVYDLAGDFGVAPAALHERYSFYTDRFAIPQETP
ncbi:MAG: sulfotransferase [Propionibacteriales bacterium]|nr:sulfotransferase [Propionibacteriales bacterium]